MTTTTEFNDFKISLLHNKTLSNRIAMKHIIEKYNLKEVSNNLYTGTLENRIELLNFIIKDRYDNFGGITITFINLFYYNNEGEDCKSFVYEIYFD